MNTERQIWMRLGVVITADEDTIKNLMAGDTDTLRNVIKDGKFVPEGDSYIPQPEIIYYNKVHGTSFNEMSDVDFDM